MKTIAYLLLNNFAPWEMAYLAPAAILLGRGEWKNCFLSIKTDPILSLGGFQLMPDGDLSELPDAADVLVLVGGLDWKTEAAETAEPAIKAFAKTGKPLAAICAAADELALCGLLNEKKHTGNSLADMQAWAGNAYTGSNRFIEQQAVRDGNLVTANGTASLEFAREVLRMIGIPEEDVARWYAFYNEGFFPRGE